jgi:hypothetical protein
VDSFVRLSFRNTKKKLQGAVLFEKLIKKLDAFEVT